MSDTNNVQDVRNRIIQMAREIEEYSQSNLPPTAFFSEFLKRVIAAVGARAGAVWMRNGGGRVDLLCELGLQSIGFSEDPEADVRNQRILLDVIGNGQACAYSPEESNGMELPTQDVLILAALQQNKECVGVVEIFQRTDTPPQARPGFLQFLEQMCGYACRYLDQQDKDSGKTQTSEIAEKFERFVTQLFRSLDVREVAATAANDGRLLTGADRLSVAVQYNKKTVIRAISGQDSVNRRANLVRLMEAMASKVIATGETLLYSGQTDQLAPQIEQPLADYVQESGSRMVMVVPLFESPPLIDEDDDKDQRRKKEKKQVPIGGLIVEQVSQSQPSSGLVDRVELVAPHVGTALWNARVHNQLFLMPLWRFLGRRTRWLEGRNLVKTLLVLAVIAAVILAMVFIPFEYRVEGEGQLMPVIQKDVFAPRDGDIIDVFVDSRDVVTRDQELVLIRDDELELKYLSTQKEIESQRGNLYKLEADRNNAQNRRQLEDLARIAGEMREAGIQIEHLKRQLVVLENRKKRLHVKSRIDGVVSTFQLKQMLENRPVRRGEVLMEIADPKGPWRLELGVEEHRLGHILREQLKLGVTELTVEFRLATEPDKTYQGKLDLIATRTNASESKGSIIQVYVSIEDEALKTNRHIGAEVRAKINCGERSLGYVLFGDVVEFIQKYFWL